jgi:hypothetical protein
MIDLTLIAPRQDGKFSTNLWRHLKKHQVRYGLQVFQRTKSFFDGSPTDPNAWHMGDIWIGEAPDPDWIHGLTLRALIQDRCSSTGWAIPLGVSGYREITQEFWETYLRIGRCCWDRSHLDFMRNNENRFTTIGNTRRCNWCGKWFSLQIKKKTRIERVPTWVPDQRAQVVLACLR